VSIPDEEARQVKKVSDMVAGIRKLTTESVAGSTGGRAA
jgi:hypothetical protein